MKIPSSFKDPDGFVFLHKDRIFRQINKSYKDNYDFLIKSGLYKKLVDLDVLIPHKEIDFSSNQTTIYKVIEPQIIPFISYPYEWCFSQLKDAALLTLFIQKTSLEFGMTLKDASSFNIQFLSGKPIFIDTLSFEKYKEGQPWTPYRQFCEQFLAPLALMVYKDIRLSKLLQVHVNGIPLDLAVKLLPFTSRLSPALFLHIFLHARSQKKFAHLPLSKEINKQFSRRAFLGLIESLESSVKNLSWKIGKTAWTDYYNEHNHDSYSGKSLVKKKAIVAEYLRILHPKTVWDMGANTGEFSRIAAKKGIFTVSMDNDPSVVEQNYRQVKENKEKNILPLWIDIVNPTPAVGWENKERWSFLSRRLPDTALALALVHHLAIGNNLPLSKLAAFFAKICKSLIIEFVPSEDRQARLLIQNRESIFFDYTEDVFEKEFGKFFIISKKSLIPRSKRTLYLMINKEKI